MPIAEVCQKLIDSPEMISAVAGGLIGALAGGVPAWALAKRQSNEALRRDREERNERQRALVFSVFVKLLQITTSLIGLSNHIKSCLSIIEENTSKKMEPWQVLLPAIGHSGDKGETRFSSEEMAVFAGINEYKFLQDLMLVAARNSASVDAFEEYCRMRNEFRSIAPKPTGFDRQLGYIEVDIEELNSLLPYTIAMNNAAVGLAKGLDEDLELARSVSERFGIIVDEHLKLKNFVRYSFPSDEQLAAMRRRPNVFNP